MTRKGYDVEHLIALLKGFKERYPNLELIMEPGSAFAWQTGFLLTTVVDIVENHGIKTAIIDASVHLPYAGLPGDALQAGYPFRHGCRGGETYVPDRGE